VVQARDRDQLDADAAENDRADERRMPRRDHGADARAERIAHQVGARQGEMPDQRRGVRRHAVGVVVLVIVELG
jgi:hypothetical protein